MTVATYMNQTAHARNDHNDRWEKEERCKI